LWHRRRTGTSDLVSRVNARPPRHTADSSTLARTRLPRRLCFTCIIGMDYKPSWHRDHSEVRHLLRLTFGSLAMGRKSITGGVAPAGAARIQFDFYIDRVRFRPTIRWIPNEANLRRARTYLARIKAQIAAGTFCFADEFPDYQHLRQVPVPLSARTCGEVFDAFLRHDEGRLARDDLAASTVASHRQILNHDWRPHIGHLPFLDVPYSMLVKIADTHHGNKKTYNNSVSALRRAFDFGYLDYPERRDPAAALKCSRRGKKDRPSIDPFSIQDAEVLISQLRASTRLDARNLLMECRKRLHLALRWNKPYPYLRLLQARWHR
jgi:hypothetical protein